MKKTFLFDFDGTLVDSMPTYVSAMLRILDDNGIPYEKDIVKIITPLGINGTAEYYIDLGLQLSKEQIIGLMKEYMMKAYFETIPVKKNVAEVLHQLNNEGISLNVLTASPHITLDACLKRLGLYDLFDNVWSCDDFSTTKSDPVIYKMVAEALGRDVKDIIFFDDNYNADKTAKKAGMTVCGVYDISSDDYTEEIKKLTDYYIDDFSQIKKLGII